MTRFTIWCGCCTMGLMLAGSISACRDSEPPRTYYMDLGDEKNPLPPPAPSWMDPAYKDGTAEWRPFTPLNPAAPAVAAKPAAAPREAISAEEAAGGGGSEVEAAVREFIKDYNEVVAEKAFRELPGYFVKAQRTNVRELLKVREQLVAKFNDLATALEKKSPQAGEALRAKVKILESQQSMALNVATLSVVGPTEVTGKLAAPEGSSIPEKLLNARFTRPGEDWEVELGQIDEIAATIPAMQGAVTQFDTLIAAVDSGAVPADAVVAQMDAALKALQPASSEPADTPVKTPTDEDSAEPKTEP